MVNSKSPMLLAWAVVAIFFVVDIVWLCFGRLTFAPGSLANIGWSVGATGMVYVASTAVAHRLRYDKTLIGRGISFLANGTRRALTAVAFVIASGVVGVTFSYLSASLNWPLRDAELAAIDKALGFDWLGFLAFVNQSKILSWVLVAVYHATGPQLVLVVLILSFTERGEPLANFLAVLALCNLMTGIAVTFVPAEGAYPYYQPVKEMFSNLTSHAGVWHHETLASLRNDIAPVLDFTRAQGLVTFPSFHTTIALITAWAVRDVRCIATPVALTSAAVIVSTLPEGGHHLIDLFAGSAIAAISVTIVNSLYGERSDTTLALADTHHRNG